jgi:hypothetical protein
LTVNTVSFTIVRIRHNVVGSLAASIQETADGAGDVVAFPTLVLGEIRLSGIAVLE